MKEQLNPTQLSEFEESLVVPSLGRRFINHLLDKIAVFFFAFVYTCILVFVSTIILNLAFKHVHISIRPYIRILFYTVYFLTHFVYYILFEFKTGKTIAKFFTKTRVFSVDNSPLTYKKVFIRTLCRLIPFNLLSFFFLNDHKGWHDTISKTKVLKDT
jgi:uncharacterized RDD family membrane protein YckC